MVASCSYDFPWRQQFNPLQLIDQRTFLNSHLDLHSLLSLSLSLMILHPPSVFDRKISLPSPLPPASRLLFIRDSNYA